MGNNGQNYRYGKLVVEVRRIIDGPNGEQFKCLVQGFGHSSTVPREIYVMDAETPAIASQNAAQMYINKYAKKSTQIRREQQYWEILAKNAIRFEDCHVLTFVFEQERQPKLFHYGLMLYEPRPVYFLFDCWDKYANVVVPKDEKNAAIIISIAEQKGGKKTTPNLL